MTINAVPERDEITRTSDDPKLSQPWLEFMRSVFYALFGWRRTFTALKTFDFGLIAAGGEATTTVTVTGARAGDAVSVTAKTPVAGLGVDGIVTANDTVTIRRFNFSTAGIDPASDDFRVLIFQQ